MSITVFIKELESDKALCRDRKNKNSQANLKEAGKFQAYCIRNYFIDLAAAQAKLGEAAVTDIKKRNKLRGLGVIKAEKVKEKKDLETLKPFTSEEITTWVDLTAQPKNVVDEIMASGLVSDIMNAWDVLTLNEMTPICQKCTLSWDKGRGCVATLMPSDSPVPELAKKWGLKFIQDIPKYGETKQEFGQSDAKQILQEIEKFRKELPAEGGMMVRRCTGVLDRLEAVSKASVASGVRFYFSS